MTFQGTCLEFHLIYMSFSIKLLWPKTGLWIREFHCYSLIISCGRYNYTIPPDHKFPKCSDINFFRFNFRYYWMTFRIWSASSYKYSDIISDVSEILPSEIWRCSLRELFPFYTSRKFTLITKQHYFTKNRKVEKKNLIRWKSDLIKLHFNLMPRNS